MLLVMGTQAEPFIVSTYLSDYEDSESREITVFGEDNARNVFKRKVSSEAYTCVRLDRAKFGRNGRIDYVGKGGKLDYWVGEGVGSGWMMDDRCQNSDIPWWVDNEKREEDELSDESYYATSGDPWDV